MPNTIPITLDRPAIHVEVSPGGEIIIRGMFTSAFDGSIVDAATTTWPAGSPGGASVDPGGLIDFEAGGFHMTSRDPVTHVVHAIATNEGGAACSALGVAAPCLPLRVLPQAKSRLLTVNDWTTSLKGGMGYDGDTIPPPVVAPATVPYLALAGVILALGVGGALAWSWRKKRAASPAGRLAALAKQVREKLSRADAVLAAPLAPALETALKTLRERRIDPASTEGRRVIAVLERVDTRLDESMRNARAEEEQQAADELVRDFESALEAADEARLTSKL